LSFRNILDRPSEEKRLEAKRKRAKKNLPKLEKLLKQQNDLAFTAFMQDVMDAYMMHECYLARRP
jgi:hypothetical protein